MKSSLRQLAISTLCLFPLWATFSLGQVDYGTVNGELRVRGTESPGRTLVQLQLHGSTIASTYTDQMGSFGFSSLTANSYHLVVQDERFNTADVEVRLDPGVSPSSLVHITLTPRQHETVQAGPSGNNPYMVDLSEYKRHFPKSAIKEFHKGVESDQKRKADDAIRHYEKAISLAPDFYPARNNLGSDYLGKSDFINAQKQFEEAIRLNKDDSQAYFNLGNVLTLTNKFDAAETVLHDGLQKRPDSAFGHFLLGCLYSRVGRGAEAERNLRDALQFDPNMPQAYLQLVNLYLQENRRPEAILELQSFLHTFPESPFNPKAKQVLKKLQAEQQRAVSR